MYGTIVIENDGFNKSNYVGMRIDTTIYDTEKYGLQTILKKSKVELVKDKKESYYCLKDTYGWLHIQFLDTVKHIVSGTFEFDAVNENNNLDTVKIREGRFDSRFLY
ncbi:MAG TPA: hypothetical protein VEC12_13500 [Bacteroidia bacterium]|nr:hypothetical protein [Bacteroidia bacterium]